MSEPVSALQMAQSCAEYVWRLAEMQERDPLTSRVLQLGSQGTASAAIGGNMALVSIAEDVRRLADHFINGG